MTYRVLLVDDEPIILSGIKFLIDWAQNDCQIVGTARNGRQALEFIDQMKPDIVVCDINMPVLSGVEVLQALAEDVRAPVFIMLTNLEDFDLARQALRYKAVDYLLKTQLEPETLERGIGLAKQECTRRGRLARVQMADGYLQAGKAQQVAATAQKLLNTADGAIKPEYREALAEQGVLVRYCFCS